MGILTAHYNHNTGKIEGCKEGSIIWWHEFRHKLQFESWLGKKWFFVETVLIRAIGGIFSAIAITDWSNRGIWLFGAGLTIFISSIVMFILEIDAWLYAFIKKIKNEKI